MHVKDIRRINLKALARSVGGVTKLAERLEKSQSQISHLIGTNPIKKIGDKFAAHVERIFSKPHGWLDQEHAGVGEENSLYDSGSTSTRSIPHYVPLLAWQDVQAWLSNPDKLTTNKNQLQYVITQVKVSPQAFAVRIEGDSMETANGVSFTSGAIIVVDPELPIKSGVYVVARPTTTSQFIFKQFIIDGSRRFLKPLNSRYPLIEINAHAIISGVVRLMLLEFKA
jgi:SOS-response transcriptional repressor LexA